VTERPTFDCDAVRDLADLYALGALDAGEADAVRAHLSTCADPHAELVAAASTASALLEAVEPVEPPAGLRARLLAAAEADLRTGRHPSTAGAPFTAPAPGPAPHPAAAAGPISLEAERSRRRIRWTSLAAVAALIVAVALGGWNLALRGQLAAAEAYRAGVEAALQLAAQPGSGTALLASEDGSVSGLGVVGADGTVRLALRGLPATSGDQVYAAWSIGGEGVPVNIGELRVGADGTATASAAAPGASPGIVLALTLEPATGATTPTMPIVASGTTRPAEG
jgi:anti-sigma-K factor RskA